MAAAGTVKAPSDILVRFFLAMLDAWGRSDVKVLLRSDQEVTLSLILREVQARRQQRTLVERSPVESHATMGAMERANPTLGEMWRTLKHATETRAGGRLETDQPINCWMVRHCCWIFCRYHVSADGRTPFEVLRNNSYRGGLACFGEVVWARVFEQLGQHPIEFSFSTQHVVTLSSGEAELHTTGRAAAGGSQSVQLLTEARLELMLEVPRRALQAWVCTTVSVQDECGTWTGNGSGLEKPCKLGDSH